MSFSELPVNRFHENLQLDMINEIDEHDKLITPFFKAINEAWRLFEPKDEMTQDFIQRLKVTYREGPTAVKWILFRKIVGEEMYKEHLTIEDSDYSFRIICIVNTMDEIAEYYLGLSISKDPSVGNVKGKIWS